MAVKFLKKAVVYISVLTMLFTGIWAGTVLGASGGGTAKVSVSDLAARPADFGGQFATPFGTILKMTDVNIQPGDTMASVVGRALAASGLTVGMPNGYISSIGGFKDQRGNPVASFGEGSVGDMSGWMVAINDWFADRGVNDVQVEDGDIIDVMYSCNWGEDLGASWINTDEKIGTVNFSTGRLDTPFSPDQLEYDLFLPHGAVGISARAVAQNRNNKVEIYGEDKLYKPLQNILVTDGNRIKMVCKRNIYDDESYQFIGTQEAEYTFNIKSGNKNEYDRLNAYYASQVKPKTANEMANAFDWSYIAAKALESNAMKFYPEAISDYVRTSWTGEYGFSPSTNLSRLILAATSAGLDPTRLAGRNLVASLTKYKDIQNQGVNAQSFALLALNCYPFKLSTSSVNTKESLAEGILKSQIISDDVNNGGFALTGKAADPDVTAIAIQALSTQPESNTKVREAIEKALNCLSAIQQNDGGFVGYYGKCSESVSQTIIALTCVGINPLSDTRFIKNNNTLVDALLKYYISKDTGEFSHMADDKANRMSTDQAALALGSLKLFLSGGRKLYDFSGMKLHYEKDVSAYIDISKVKISSFSGSAKTLAKVTVYKKASAKKGRLTTVKKGRKITVKSVDGLYAKVKVSGKYGYVKVTGLKFVNKQKGVVSAKTNAYKAASSKKGVWKKVSKGEKYTVASRTGQFYRTTIRIKV